LFNIKTTRKTCILLQVFYLNNFNLRLLLITLTLLILIAKLANIGLSIQKAARGIHIEL